MLVDARNFDLQMVVAAWRFIKARIELEDPTTKDPGRKAAEIVVRKINEILSRTPDRAPRPSRRRGSL